MADEKLDRRVVRTRKFLRDALLELIREKGYSQITVQDITDRANINRVTFYFHYKDKDDLLYKILQGVYDDLEDGTTADTLLEWGKQDTLASFQHIAEYAELYRTLLNEKGVPGFLGRLLDSIATSAMRAERERLPDGAQLPIPLEIVEQFYAGAFFGLARWWLLTDNAYSAEDMARLCNQLEANSGLWAMGLDDRDFTKGDEG